MKIGVDWGGTKIEAIAIDPNSGSETNRLRVDSPKDNYEEIIDKVVWLINEITKGIPSFTVGIGMPGSIHPETNLVQVSNTKALENKPVKMDIENQLGYDIKIANDADCLALSEAIDGAGSEHNSVFAVILGTGVGAGYSVNKQIIVGPNKLTGEWGQNPIPGPMDDYEKSIKRHCGRIGAIEVFLTEVMDIYFERIARSFSTFVNILDPDIIVCGGGMSEIDDIYSEVPKRIISYIASNFFLTPIVKATHGSSSGVRGAAHLWN